MKRFFGIILVILSILSISVSAYAFQKDGVYDCKYQIDKYSTGGCMFITDKNGEITTTLGSTESPSAETLINSGNCTFTPNTRFTCKYPKGVCNVKIMAKGGHEVSCTGDTPDTSEVYNAVKNGRCIKDK